MQLVIAECRHALIDVCGIHAHLGHLRTHVRTIELRTDGSKVRIPAGFNERACIDDARLYGAHEAQVENCDGKNSDRSRSPRGFFHECYASQFKPMLPSGWMARQWCLKREQETSPFVVGDFTQPL